MKLSLCLETVFADRPFVERMRAASILGYSAIEFWDWGTKDLAAIMGKAAQFNLTIAAMSGNRKHILIDPKSRTGLMAEMDQVFSVAQQLNCCHLMMLSDVLATDGSAVMSPPLSNEEKFESMVEGLRALVHQAADAGVVLLLEPLNMEVTFWFVFWVTFCYQSLNPVMTPRNLPTIRGEKRGRSNQTKQKKY
jgi:hydroxypyruvate isomerase